MTLRRVVITGDVPQRRFIEEMTEWPWDKPLPQDVTDAVYIQMPPATKPRKRRHGGVLVMAVVALLNFLAAIYFVWNRDVQWATLCAVCAFGLYIIARMESHHD